MNKFKNLSIKESLEKYNTFSKSIPIKKVLLGFLGIAIFIFFLGFIVSWIKIEFPKKMLPKFEQSKYFSASEAYKSPENILYFNIKEIQDYIEEKYTNGEITKDASNILVQDVLNKYDGKTVIIQNLEGDFINDKIKTLYNEKIEEFKSKKDSAKNAFNNSYYKERSKWRDMYYEYDNKIKYLETFYQFVEGIGIQSTVHFPERNINQNFNYTVGKFKIENQGSSKLIMCENSRAIISDEFLTKTKIPKEYISKELLDADREIFKDIKSKEEESFDIRKSQVKETLKKTTKNNRKRFRGNFYFKWYANLLSLITSIVSILLLFKYFKIIQRKGLPKKSTYNVYFATNVSSLIFRWIALIVILVGGLHIFLDFLFGLFKSEVLGTFSFLPGFGFLHSLVAPFLTIIAAVVASWIFVVHSEFICFLSNVYHIVFIKSHNEKE